MPPQSLMMVKQHRAVDANHSAAIHIVDPAGNVATILTHALNLPAVATPAMSLNNDAPMTVNVSCNPDTNVIAVHIAVPTHTPNNQSSAPHQDSAGNSAVIGTVNNAVDSATNPGGSHGDGGPVAPIVKVLPGVEDQLHNASVVANGLTVPVSIVSNQAKDLLPNAAGTTQQSGQHALPVAPGVVQPSAQGLVLPVVENLQPLIQLTQPLTHTTFGKLANVLGAVAPEIQGVVVHPNTSQITGFVQKNGNGPEKLKNVDELWDLLASKTEKGDLSKPAQDAVRDALRDTADPVTCPIGDGRAIVEPVKGRASPTSQPSLKVIVLGLLVAVGLAMAM